jgi:lysophospholipase L1-like esterase
MTLRIGLPGVLVAALIVSAAITTAGSSAVAAGPSLDPSSWRAYVDGATKEITVSTGTSVVGKPRVVVDEADKHRWVKVTQPSPAPYTLKFKVTADKNTSPTERSASITVSVPSGTVKLKISQYGSPTISPSSWNPPNTETTSIKFSVTTGGAKPTGLSAKSSDTSWLTAKVIDEKKFTLKVTKNNGNKRTAKVTVTVCGVNRTVTVTQASKTTLDLSHSSSWNPNSSKNSLKDVKVTTNQSKWTASSSATSWLTVDRSSGKSGDKFKITVTANTGNERVGKITVKAAELSKTITVTQMPGKMTVDVPDLVSKTKTLNILGGTVMTRRATVRTKDNAAWIASSSTKWLDVIIGNDKRSLTLLARTNVTGKVRKATVVLSMANKPKEVNYQFTVAQSALSGIKYVALGDSFSAGTGAFGDTVGLAADAVRMGINNEILISPPQSAPASGYCFRSTASWPTLLATEIGAWNTKGTVNNFTFRACSGAETKEVLSVTQYPNLKVYPQITEKNLEKANLVTITIGGNDIGFANLVTACILWDCPYRVSTTYQEVGMEITVDMTPRIVSNTFNMINDKISNSSGTYLGPSLKKTYEAILKQAPNATIAVLGYPPMMPATGNGCWPLGYPDGSSANVDTGRKVIKDLNAAIKNSVESVRKGGPDKQRLIFIPADGPNSPFVREKNRDVCGGSSSFVSLPRNRHFLLGFDEKGADILEMFLQNPWVFHPNKAGNKALKEIVYDGLK